MLIYEKTRLISFEIIKFALPAISALFSGGCIKLAGPPGGPPGQSAARPGAGAITFDASRSFRAPRSFVPRITVSTVMRGTTVTDFSCRSFLSATTNQTSLAFNRKFTKITRESHPHVLNMLEQAFKIPGRTNFWFWAQTKQLKHL